MSKQRKRGRKSVPASVSPNGTGRRAAKKPIFDAALRELRVGKAVVKCFMQASDAQEVILMAFQEENWPQSIDDPLTGKDGQVATQLLRTTVANLNRRQCRPLLHFCVKHQGTAVGWAFHGRQRQ